VPSAGGVPITTVIRPLVTEPSPFSAVILKVNEPALVGVPDKMPSLLSANPGGRDPDANENVGNGNPAAAKVNEYGTPTSPPEPPVVSRARVAGVVMPVKTAGPVMVSVVVAWLLAVAAASVTTTLGAYTPPWAYAWLSENDVVPAASVKDSGALPSCQFTVPMKLVAGDTSVILPLSLAADPAVPAPALSVKVGATSAMVAVVVALPIPPWPSLSATVTV